MERQTVIFMGPSGSGKGTQAKLLAQFLDEHDPARELFALELGQGFRELIQQDNFTAKREREVMEAGIRAPAMLAIYITAKQMMDQIKHEDYHYVIDGTSRSLPEAKMVIEMLKFYSRRNITVLFFDVAREWAVDRMLERGRADDTIEDINSRLDWYEADVLPSVSFFREHKDVTVIDINGAQDIEDVHKEILEKLSLKK